MMENELVTIRGLTQKGRYRINEHGNIWRVHKRASNGDFLLESVRTKYLKWLNPDFEIVEQN